MLTDPVEIEIASRAKQPGIRNPDRSREPFVRIFDDFIPPDLVQGRSILDLGPGQWDFSELARDRGAGRLVGIDNDPPVVELGEHKGFEAVLSDLRAVDPVELGRFDAVFCKFSISAFWCEDDEAASELATRIATLVSDDGWSWIAPWNGMSAGRRLEPHVVERLLAIQADAFERAGYRVYELSDELVRSYGVTGLVENHALFVRNLPVPPAVSACERA